MPLQTLNAGFIPNESVKTPPDSGNRSARKNTFLYVRQGQSGKEYYRITLYEKGTTPGAQKHQLSLTEDQWKDVIEPLMETTLLKVDALASSAIKKSFQFTASPTGLDKFETLDEQKAEDMTTAIKAKDVNEELNKIVQAFYTTIGRLQPQRVALPQGEPAKTPPPPPPTQPTSPPRPEPTLPLAPFEVQITPEKRVQNIGWPSIGLPNPPHSNNCFANALFQSEIVDNPILSNALLNADLRAEDPDLDPAVQGLSEFIESYDQHRKGPSTLPPPNTQKVKEALDALGYAFGTGQHDPGEMKETLLGILQIESALKENGYYRNLVTKRYYETKNRVPVELDRDENGYFSVQKDPFNGSLPIPIPGREESLQQAVLRELQGPSPMDATKHDLYPDGVKWEDVHPPKKDLPQPMKEVETQQTSFSRSWDAPPEELIFTLMRWKNESGNKNDDAVNVDEFLEIPAHLIGDEQPRRYQLMSYIEHIGDDPTNGHYVAYKKEKEGCVLLDDARRVPLAESREESRVEFLNKAKKAYRLRYVLVKP